MEILHHYNEDHNTTSANEIVPYILELLPEKPKSVIDIGCGPGQWLKVFKDNGIENVLGVDGEHVPQSKILIDTDNEFKRFDLRNIKNLNLKKRFDLLLTLEVAEHLPIEVAKDFIRFLTDTSDIIVFSAAIIGQTGENHINEQGPSYWKELFKSNGFIMLDPFREKFWNNNNVNWWYKQNMYAFIKKERMNSFSIKEFENFYIHPDLFYLKENMNNKPQHNNSFYARIKRSLALLLKGSLQQD